METLAPAFEDIAGFSQKKVKPHSQSQSTIFPLKVKLLPGVGKKGFQLVDQHPCCTNGELSNSATPQTHRFETVGLLLRFNFGRLFFRKEGANLLHIVVISGKASICDPRRFAPKNKKHTHTQNPRISPALDVGNLNQGPSIYNFQVIQSK